MTDLNTRVKLIIGDLFLQNAQANTLLEERDARIAELEALAPKPDPAPEPRPEVPQ